MCEGFYEVKFIGLVEAYNLKLLMRKALSRVLGDQAGPDGGSRAGGREAPSEGGSLGRRARARRPPCRARVAGPLGCRGRRAVAGQGQPGEQFPSQGLDSGAPGNEGTSPGGEPPAGVQAPPCPREAGHVTTCARTRTHNHTDAHAHTPAPPQPFLGCTLPGPAWGCG